MSQLFDYITSLENQTFDYIRDHFISKHCRVFESGNLYMIFYSNNTLLENQLNNFKDAMTDSIGTILKKNTNEIVC